MMTTPVACVTNSSPEIRSPHGSATADADSNISAIRTLVDPIAPLHARITSLTGQPRVETLPAAVRSAHDGFAELVQHQVVHRQPSQNFEGEPVLGQPGLGRFGAA